MIAEIISSSMSLAKDTDLVSYKILVDGADIPGKYHIVSMTVQYEINKIPSARIFLADCSDKKEDFTIASIEDFNPGKKIEIKLGYHNNTETVFKGMIVKNSPKVNNQCAEITIECKDETVKMTVSRSGRNYRNMTDNDIVTELLDKNKIPDKEVNDIETNHEQLVQQNVTDWDYMIGRIDVNAAMCLIKNGSLTVRKPDLAAASVLQLTHGANIFEFHADMDSLTQSSQVKTYSWDFDNQKVRETESDEFEITEDSDENDSGNGSPKEPAISIDQLAAVVSKPYEMITSYLSEEEQKGISNAKKIRQVLSKIKGRVKYQGLTKAMPGDFIRLNGLGDHFNGKAFVSAIQHEYADGDWTTEATLGWDDKFFAETTNPQHPASATGQVSSVQGLQAAVVTSIEDGSGQYRVKVRLPLTDKSDEGIYARVATLDAGDKRGTFFRPEIDDEVLVGFMNDDPRHPVILGMMHSSKKQSPLEPENENHKKGYVSRSGIKMLFDDEKKSMIIETPGSRIVELDDDAGSITIKDDNGNKIVMDANGISIEAVKDLVLKAGKSISLSAPEVSLKADATMNIEGSGTTAVKSGGITEIKGSLVKIN